MASRWVLAAPALLALAGCGGTGDTAAPGEATRGEAKALDEAEQMIREARPAPSPAPMPSGSATGSVRPAR